MNYRIETLDNEPVNIWTGFEGFKWGTPEHKRVDDELKAIWEASEEPLYHIADVSRVELDVEQLMAAASSVAQGAQALWAHPKVIEVVLVTQDPAILLSINLLNQSKETGKGPYRSLNVVVVETIDAALTYARERIQSN